MELGATICLPRRPLCLICPLKNGCAGRSHPEDFPVKSRVASVKRAETVAILRHRDRFYCEQVAEGKPWHGLWRFPDFDQARMKQGVSLVKLKYGITKYAVTMEAIEAKWKGRAPISMSVRYLTAKEMSAFAFAAPHRKLMKCLLVAAPAAAMAAATSMTSAVTTSATWTGAIKAYKLTPSLGGWSRPDTAVVHLLKAPEPEPQEYVRRARRDFSVRINPTTSKRPPIK